MINAQSNIKDQSSKFNLELRTKEFGKQVIRLCKKIKITTISRPIISQLIRSATSIGANYHEATECNSKKDFKHRVVLSKKEAKETMYWLEMLSEIEDKFTDEIRLIREESHELVLILSVIVRKTEL